MPDLSLGQIASIVSAGVPAEAASRLVAGYAIDTRLMKPGEIFFALKGETRDGHEFVEEACRRGAIAAVVERRIDGLPKEFVQILVPSALASLGSIARYVRTLSKVPVIAVTGSNGKTTTKEMIAHLLAIRLAVRKSPGNFNNHIGLPLSILTLDARDSVLVVELGSNHRGEIATLAKIAKPDVGVVTNVGRAHIGFFGSIEAVAQEKTDLLRSLGPGGKGVVNADDKYLTAALAGMRVSISRFGLGNDADFRAYDVRPDIDAAEGGGSRFSVEGVPIALKVGGLHNVYNALAALATADLFGVGIEEAAGALAGFEPMRMKAVSCGGLVVIDDTYNANPDSVAAALEVLARAKAGRRVFIMGEMLELGAASERLHREVGERVAAVRIQVFVGIGDLTREATAEAVRSGMNPAQVFWFETKAAAKEALKQILKPDDLILVKGSRLAGLDEITDFLKTSAVAGRT